MLGHGTTGIGLSLLLKFHRPSGLSLHMISRDYPESKAALVLSTLYFFSSSPSLPPSLPPRLSSLSVLSLFLLLIMGRAFLIAPFELTPQQSFPQAAALSALPVAAKRQGQRVITTST